MTATVLVSDEQNDRATDGDRIGALARHALAAQGVSERAEVGVTAVDRDRIAELNLAYRAKEGATDVLSFPIDGSDEPEPAGYAGDARPPLLLGDIVICPSVAAETAIAHGVDYGAEIDLLVVHGVLHLLGYDHVDPDEADAMEALERRILESFEYETEIVR